MESEYGDPNHNFGARQQWRYYETNLDQEYEDDYWPRRDFKRPPNERQYDDSKGSTYEQYQFEAEQAQFRHAWENMRAQQKYRNYYYDDEYEDYDDDHFNNPFYDYWDQKEAFYEDINGERATHYRNMWNEAHNAQFNPGHQFFGGGARGPQSHDDFYEREHVNNWQQNMGWKEPKQSRKKRAKKKKTKKDKNKKNTAKTDKVDEFYAKLARRGGGEVVIGGKVHTVKLRNGELIIKLKA